MYYYGYTNEKTDKTYFKNTLKTFDYISPLQTIYDSHVSFNGRAYVAEKLEYKESVKNDVVVRAVLISYNTIVCEWNQVKGFVRYWDGYSATTMRHINEFRKQQGYPSISKKTWEDLPVKKWEE